MSNQNRSGWVKTDNQKYKEELIKKRRDRNAKKPDPPRCDHCLLGDHDNCWRVVCHCRCDEERVRDRLKERDERLGL